MYEEKYYEESEEVRRMLYGDESILWTGQPDKMKVFYFTDIFTTVFAAGWTVFIIFWMTLAYLEDSPIEVVISGVPFLLIGLYLLFGQYIYRYLALKATHYYISNQRIIIQKKKGNIIEYNITDFDDVVKINDKGEMGSIVFLPQKLPLNNPFLEKIFYSMIQGLQKGISFNNIDRVDKAKTIIDEIRKGYYL